MSKATARKEAAELREVRREEKALDQLAKKIAKRQEHRKKLEAREHAALDKIERALGSTLTRIAGRGKKKKRKSKAVKARRAKKKKTPSKKKTSKKKSRAKR